MGHEPDNVSAYTARAAEGETVVGDFHELTETTFTLPEDNEEVTKNE